MILYTKEGVQIDVEHAVDFKAAIATGRYFVEKPEEEKSKKAAKQEVVVKDVKTKKEESIPVEDKKKEPTQVKNEDEKPVAVKNEKKEKKITSDKLRRTSGSGSMFRSK